MINESEELPQFADYFLITSKYSKYFQLLSSQRIFKIQLYQLLFSEYVQCVRL